LYLRGPTSKGKKGAQVGKGEKGERKGRRRERKGRGG